MIEYLNKYWTKFFAHVALVLFITQAINIVLIALVNNLWVNDITGVGVFMQYNWAIYFAMTVGVSWLFTRDAIESLKIGGVVWAIIALIMASIYLV